MSDPNSHLVDLLLSLRIIYNRKAELRNKENLLFNTHILHPDTFLSAIFPSLVQVWVLWLVYCSHLKTTKILYDCLTTNSSQVLVVSDISAQTTTRCWRTPTPAPVKHTHWPPLPAERGQRDNELSRSICKQPDSQFFSTKEEEVMKGAAWTKRASAPPSGNEKLFKPSLWVPALALWAEVLEGELCPTAATTAWAATGLRGDLALLAWPFND